jgi:DNA-binding NtrC family response regulator
VHEAGARPPPRLTPMETLKDIADRAVAVAEREAIRLALLTTHGNTSEAARLLRVDYKTLHLKIKNYGIDPRLFRP